MIKKLQNYAKLLLTTGVNLQEGQPLFISADIDSKDFVLLLTKEAYDLGAKDVTVNWRWQPLAKERLLRADSTVLENPRSWIPTFYQNHLDENCAFISLISANPEALKGIPVERISLQMLNLNRILEFYHHAIMTSSVTWCVAAVATPLWANLLDYEGTEDEKLALLWDTIFNLCRMEEKDGSLPFKQHLESLKRRRTKLTDYQLKKLHYICPNGTDLWVEMPEQHIWQGGAEVAQTGILFTANIPTEEVYSAPHYLGVNGTVYSTKPLIYHGNTISNFSLTFSEGKVSSYSAEEGEAYLRELLETDEASSYLGEIALVDHYSPISQSGLVYYETLFDENASCHLALGSAYPTCLENGESYNNEELKSRGLNHSLTHVDFMIGHENMSIIGYTKDDIEIPIMENGRLLL